ncbi:MAG: hypothetical protein JWP52_2899, partial [Rhizobacter sp.]|nr:hypothetical protein [Rhizobacter sp.]
METPIGKATIARRSRPSMPGSSAGTPATAGASVHGNTGDHASAVSWQVDRPAASGSANAPLAGAARGAAIDRVKGVAGHEVNAAEAANAAGAGAAGASGAAGATDAASAPAATSISAAPTGTLSRVTSASMPHPSALLPKPSQTAAMPRHASRATTPQTVQAVRSTPPAQPDVARSSSAQWRDARLRSDVGMPLQRQSVQGQSAQGQDSRFDGEHLRTTVVNDAPASTSTADRPVASTPASTPDSASATSASAGMQPPVVAVSPTMMSRQQSAGSKGQGAGEQGGMPLRASPAAAGDMQPSATTGAASTGTQATTHVRAMPDIPVHEAPASAEPVMPSPTAG